MYVCMYMYMYTYIYIYIYIYTYPGRTFISPLKFVYGFKHDHCKTRGDRAVKLADDSDVSAFIECPKW